MTSPLVLIAGQSNALGFGNCEPAPYTPTARVQMWNESALRFEYMNPGVNTGGLLHPTCWGPEVAFANAWLADNADNSDILYIGKVARGSTSLAADTELDWSPLTGEMFKLANEVAVHMRANLDRPIDAVLWMQGETDATDVANANAYYDNLASLISNARVQWMSDNDGRFIIARIGDSPALPFAGMVRVAQWAMGVDDANVESFRTIDFDYQPDTIHLSAAGQLQLGDTFYSHFNEWIV